MAGAGQAPQDGGGEGRWGCWKAQFQPRLRGSRWAREFLDGVNITSLGLMAVVTWKLAVAALFDWITIGLALLSGAVVWRYKVNSAWLVLAGAVIGLLVHVVG